MKQSGIPPQELITRLCSERNIKGSSPFDDRRKVSALRSVVDQLPIVRDLGNKNLHGWELDLDAEDAA